MSGAGINRGAGCHDIVDQQHAAAGDGGAPPLMYAERACDVAPPGGGAEVLVDGAGPRGDGASAKAFAESARTMVEVGQSKKEGV